MKIFVADDDEAIVDATTMMLEIVGYEVESTLNGEEVFTFLTTSCKPDVVILDIWMSGVDGRDVCRSLKSDNATAHIPILMISASRDVMESAFKSGADDFLAKPFEMEELLNKVATLAVVTKGESHTRYIS